MKRALAAAAAVALGCASAGCSVLLDWNGFTGGTVDGGTDGHAGDDANGDDATGDASGDAPGDDGTSTTCALACETAPPSGWIGPVALSVAPSSQGAAPACGAGFNASPAFDGYADLTVDPAACSACSCAGSASGVTCSGPTISFFSDTGCTSPTGSPLTVTASCVTTPPAAQSVTLAGPTATGGTCVSSGGMQTAPAATWGRIARACTPSTVTTGSGCIAGQVCATAPASPFSASPCVLQSGAATACPAEYPNGPQVFYAGVDDQRVCSSCTCTGPTGAQCAAPSPAVDVSVIPQCQVTISTLSAPSTCTSFQGPELVTLAGPATVSNPGTCSLSGGGTPSGTATAASPTSFCCQN